MLSFSESLFSKPSLGKKDPVIIHPWKNAVLISIIYIVLAAVYIVVSTHYAAQHADSVEAMQASELQKGIIYVIVTGLGLLVFAGVQFRMLAFKEKKILEQRNALLISERHAVAGILASSIAHDINNVVTILDTHLERLFSEIGENEATLKRFERLRDGNKQLSVLSNRLMQAGRTNRQEKPSFFSLSRLMKQTVEFTKSHRAVQRCTVHLHCPDKLSMNGFPEMVEQMLFNLILNAAEAAKSPGRIYIDVNNHDDRFHITVEDNGTGIRPDERHHIFNPFYTSKETGTGLGMLSVKACVEAHGGDITIGDSSLGGARLTIGLPVNFQKDSASSADSAAVL